jgi:hypothetical protein
LQSLVQVPTRAQRPSEGLLLPFGFLSPSTRLRLSLGGFCLSTRDLRRCGGLAGFFLFAGLPFRSRFLRRHLGMCLRHMDGEIQDLQRTVRTPDRLWGSLNCARILA